MSDHEPETEGLGFERHHEHEPEWVGGLKQYIRRQIRLSESRILKALQNPNVATHFQVLIGGTPAMANITLNVDVAGEVIEGQWLDDKNEVTPTAPNAADGNPASFSYSSSDDTIVTVDPKTGALSFLLAGSATLTTEVVDSFGNVDASFAAETTDLTLTPGTGTSFQVSVNGAAPVPSPGA